MLAFDLAFEFLASRMTTRERVAGKIVSPAVIYFLGLQDVSISAVMTDMKMGLILGCICAFLLGGLAVFLVQRNHTEAVRHDRLLRQRADANEIIAVLKQVSEAAKQPKKVGRGGGNQMAVASKLVAGIDTSRCPKDFRLAWFDLGVAAQKASRPNSDALVALVVGGVELASGVGAAAAASTTLPTLAKSGQKHQDAQDAFADALLNVKRVAIQHGVIFHPANP